MDTGGGGVKKRLNFADVLYRWPLIFVTVKAKINICGRGMGLNWTSFMDGPFVKGTFDRLMVNGDTTIYISD